MKITDIIKLMNAGNILCGIIILAGFICWLFEKDKELIHSTPIYSLQTKQKIQGSFTLGCGSINQFEKYFFYIRGERGFILHNVDVCDVELIETTNGRPRLEQWSYKFGKKGNSPTYFMYVPKNTIYNKFDSKIDN